MVHAAIARATSRITLTTTATVLSVLDPVRVYQDVATLDLPVWVAVVGTPASAQRAGQLGLPMALGWIGGTIGHAKRLVDLYRTAGSRDAGHPDEQLTSASRATSTSGRPPSRRCTQFYPYYHRYLSPETNGGRGWYVDRDAMAGLAARPGAAR